MKLSVIIPAYNEKDTIEEIITRVRAVDLSKEIIVVDDGSSDGTGEIVQGMQGEDLIYCRHDQNQGKGAAIRTGLNLASGELVIIQDADLEYDPQEYPALLEPIRQKQARVVYGSRILKSGNRRSSHTFYWGGRLVSLVTNLLYGSKLSDEATCYKVFETALLKDLDLTCQGFEFCPEVTSKVLRRGIEIKEIPISYNPRGREQGKKITAKDGLEAIWILLKNRFRS